MTGPIARSIEACNTGDRAAWLTCYHPDVEWAIVADRTLRGLDEVATLWESMVEGTGERTVNAEAWSGPTDVAAVVGHHGGEDTIVCCELDGVGRIRRARSYRTGERDVAAVPEPCLAPGDTPEVVISMGSCGVVQLRDAAGGAVIVEWGPAGEVRSYGR